MRSRSVSLSGNGTIFLGGPPLVKASTGEEVSAEATDGTNERPGPAMSSYVQLCPAMSSYVQLCPMDGYMIYVLHHVASCWVDGGVCPAFTHLVSSVCQMQSAHDQKWAFRCGEIAIFTNVCDVQWMSVLLSGVNITFNFSKKWKFGATLTRVCWGDTLAFWAFFSLFTSSTRHLQNTWLDWLCQSCWQWTEQKPSLSLPGLSSCECIVLTNHPR